VLLDRGPVTLPVPADAVESANVAGSGFYRVRLSDTALARIGEQGAPTDDAIERYGIVDDAWALTLAGELRAEQFLALTEGFRHDPDLSVWQRVIGALDAVTRAVDPATPHLLDERLHVLFAPMRAHLGGAPRPGEEARTAELRAALLEADALLAHDTDAIAHAQQLHATGGAHPALAAAAVRVVATNGDAARYDEYLAAMRDAATPQETERYRSALALFPGEAEMRRTIAACLDGTIRSQDAPFVLRSALRNRHQGPAVWAALTEQWDTLRTVIPSMLVARLLEGISALAEPGLAEGVEAFLAEHDVPQGRTVIAQHRERLRVHTTFRLRERPALAALVNP
jgi:aminopeptidase N